MMERLVSEEKIFLMASIRSYVHLKDGIFEYGTYELKHPFKRHRLGETKTFDDAMAALNAPDGIGVVVGEK
jgi:hypothetical protein